MAECEAMGVRAIGIAADVTVRADVERMFAETLGAFGRVDIVVNNAGGMLRPPERNLGLHVRRPTTGNSSWT